MKKISIIIPVYNAEKYIHKCIESVLKQTYKNIEIILLDDGSKDNSLNEINKYKNRKNVIISSHKNMGVGKTRNYGLKIATGDYIVFLDSDDWIEENYIKTFVSNIKDNDILVSGFQRFSKDYIFQYKREPAIEEWSKFKYCSVAGKMFKKDFLDKYDIRYNKIQIAEDASFNIRAYSKTSKIVVIPYAGYCNYENVHSVTNVKEKKIKTFKISLDDIEKNIPKDSSLRNDSLYFYYIKSLIIDVFINSEILSIEELNKLFIDDYNWYCNVLSNNNRKIKLYYQKGESFLINILVNCFIIFKKIHIQKILIFIIKKFNIKMI